MLEEAVYDAKLQMKEITLLLAIYSAVAAPAPKVEPWPKVRIEGRIELNEGIQLFGEGEKRFVIETPVNHYHMAFASTADYQATERLTGQVAAIEAHLVRHGGNVFVVPLSVVAKTK